MIHYKQNMQAVQRIRADVTDEIVALCHGLSQRQIGEITGLTQAEISKLLNKQATRHFSIDRLFLVLFALGARPTVEVEVMSSAEALERAWPAIKWREPMVVQWKDTWEDRKSYACRVCIANKGLNMSSEHCYPTEDEAVAHIKLHFEKS